MSALNKTSITSVPLTWSEGFHFVNMPPVLDDIYLFHMKFADINGRANWFRHMRSSVDEGGSESGYFSPSLQWMAGHRDWLLRRMWCDGWYGLLNDGFDERFLATVTRNPVNGMYSGDFFEGSAIFDIPAEFNQVV